MHFLLFSVYKDGRGISWCSVSRKIQPSHLASAKANPTELIAPFSLFFTITHSSEQNKHEFRHEWGPMKREIGPLSLDDVACMPPTNSGLEKSTRKGGVNEWMTRAPQLTHQILAWAVPQTSVDSWPKWLCTELCVGNWRWVEVCNSTKLWLDMLISTCTE